MTLTVRKLEAAGIGQALEDLARLRIAVFGQWPYLYDGSMEYEAGYIREFAAAEGSTIIAACDGDRIVGAATASPMWAQKAGFRAPFAARGIDGKSLFYFGESVLLPEYRGLGIGNAFFDERERHARALGATVATFAAVVRHADDPRRPAGYVSLEPFWSRRGYGKIDGLLTEFSWREHGEAGESAKQMEYWIRSL